MVTVRPLIRETYKQPDRSSYRSVNCWMAGSQDRTPSYQGVHISTGGRVSKPRVSREVVVASRENPGTCDPTTTSVPWSAAWFCNDPYTARHGFSPTFTRFPQDFSRQVDDLPGFSPCRSPKNLAIPPRSRKEVDNTARLQVSTQVLPVWTT